MLVIGIVSKQVRMSRNLFENLKKSGLPPGSVVEMPVEVQSLYPGTSLTEVQEVNWSVWF